jgi:hypothetical protein
MKFSRFIAIAVAAIFCGGPLAVALAEDLPIQLADNLPTQRRIVVPVPAQVRRVVTTQEKKVVMAQVNKVVRAPYRKHHHHYVEVPKYGFDCFGVICLQKAIGYRHYSVYADHDSDHD